MISKEGEKFFDNPIVGPTKVYRFVVYSNFLNNLQNKLQRGVQRDAWKPRAIIYIEIKQSL